MSVINTWQQRFRFMRAPFSLYLLAPFMTVKLCLPTPRLSILGVTGDEGSAKLWNKAQAQHTGFWGAPKRRGRRRRRRALGGAPPQGKQKAKNSPMRISYLTPGPLWRQK